MTALLCIGCFVAGVVCGVLLFRLVISMVAR